jgi:hypothetical protein
MRMRRALVLIASSVWLVACNSAGSSPAKAPGKKPVVAGPDGGKAEADGGAVSSTGQAGGSGGAVSRRKPDAAMPSQADAASGSSDASSGDAASAQAPLTPLAKLPDAFAAAICDAIEACVGKSALMELTHREDCVTRVAAELRATEFAYMDMAIATGHVLYDSNKLPQCADGIRALRCDVLSHSFPQACVDVLVGNVAQGDGCLISAECQGRAFCAGSNACPSHCAPLLGEGDACSGDNQCGDDLTCEGDHCVRPSLAGEPCGGQSGKGCHLGLSCDGATDTQAGHCVDNASVQVGALGAACQPGGQLCKEGFSCVFDGSNAFHCEAPVGSGGPCHLGLPGQCPSGEYCDATDVTIKSSCKPLPAEGAGCVLSGQCAAGLACVQESSGPVCRAIEANGGACGADSACRSGHCQAGACVPPPACL